MTTTQKIALVPTALALMLGGGALMSYAGLASAQTNTNGTATSTPTGMHRGAGHWGPGMMGGRSMGHGVMGTVTSVNGTTVTVTGKDGTTYTVDASNAKVDKIVSLTVGDIKVGDTIGVEGKVSGSTVTAGHIMDGIPPKPGTAPQGQTQ